MAYDKFDQLYDALKADGALSGDRESFKKYVYAPGETGYKNRKTLFDALKADGAIESATYEEFVHKLGLQAVKQPEQPLEKSVANGAAQTGSMSDKNGVQTKARDLHFDARTGRGCARNAGGCRGQPEKRGTA